MYSLKLIDGIARNFIFSFQTFHKFDSLLDWNEANKLLRVNSTVTFFAAERLQFELNKKKVIVRAIDN